MSQQWEENGRQYERDDSLGFKTINWSNPTDHTTGTTHGPTENNHSLPDGKKVHTTTFVRLDKDIVAPRLRYESGVMNFDAKIATGVADIIVSPSDHLFISIMKK